MRRGVEKTEMNEEVKGKGKIRGKEIREQRKAYLSGEIRPMRRRATLITAAINTLLVEGQLATESRDCVKLQAEALCN